jgi:hypothetical protein
MITCQMNASEKRKETTRHLSTVTLLDGYYCIGWITTTASGKLVSFDNAAPIPIKIGIIPKGSRIVLFSNGRIQSVCLGKPTRLNGIPCIGYGPESPAIAFYPEGGLRACYLSKDTRIQGIFCHHGSFSRVVFDMEGRLISCELARTQVIRGQLIKSRSVITFDENRKIVKIRTSNALRSFFFDTLDKIL